MTNVTIKQLRYFEALAQQQHFGRAAAACAISQPALSVQIRELERELGQALFERSARHVRLTTFGADFAPQARVILQGVEELEAFARVARDPLAGRFRMGIIPTIAPYMLPRLIPALASAFPALDLDVRETLTAQLTRELGEGRIDAAIVALPVSEPGLAEHPLFDEPFLLVRQAAFRGEPVPQRGALGQMRLLLLEEGHCFRDQALSFCQTRSPPPAAGLDGTSLGTLVQMVGAGIGVTIIPQMARSVETRSADVACDPFPEPSPGRRIGMVWRKTNPLAEAFAQIARVVQQIGSEVVGAGKEAS